ncbi:MAG: crossover junction endodeoxyribonuclease RuvC, crossover junction endodeoxyribonuclease RuvC [Candidatus Parcubacteria bacterium]|jgi:crossover junction endodeoxyribonuclease RuvC
MRVLAIDPGYERLGIAILDKQKIGERKPSLVFSTCFQTSAKDSHSRRLAQIHSEIQRVLEEYSPTHLGIETLFFSKNVKTAIKVAEARGLILALAEIYNLKIVELSPQQIKIAVTGYGNSDKNAIIKMVPLLIEIENKIKFDDEFDAIATGLCVLAHN